MDKLTKKLEEISSLLKVAIMPSLRVPGPVAPSAPKIPSLAPKTKKNPIKVAEQIKNKTEKSFAMNAAQKQVNATKNMMALSMNKSEGNSHLYHIIKDGHRMTSEPVSIEHVNVNYGGVKRLEASGHYLVPVKQEELSYDRRTSQWSLRPKK